MNFSVDKNGGKGPRLKILTSRLVIFPDNNFGQKLVNSYTSSPFGTDFECGAKGISLRHQSNTPMASAEK